MNYISIHDTHKLPYFNGKVTAKSKQSGNTTPLVFINAENDEPLGYEIYTNARGYLCDKDGNLFTKGVFVMEDAYVTLTLGDGSSTSWIVRTESDIKINDGVLFGREVTPEEIEAGVEYKEIGGIKRIVLHSANTGKDNVLNMGDLNGVPPINEWKEVEDVVSFSLSKKTYDISEYAKILVMQWSGSNPSNHNPVDITLGYDKNGNRYRYAQHCMVYNASKIRFTLKDKNSGKVIGSVDPSGTLNIGLFFFDNSTTGNWIEDEDRVLSNSSDASTNLTDTVVITGSGTHELEVNDRTPSFLKIVADANTASTQVPKASVVSLFLTASRDRLRKDKRVTISFQNNSSSMKTLPMSVYIKTGDGKAIASVFPGEHCELLVRGLSGNETLVNRPPLLMTPFNEPYPHTVNFTMNNGTKQNVPLRVEQVNVTAGGSGVCEFHFLDDTKVVTFKVENKNPSPLWMKLMGSNTLWAVCPGNTSCDFAVLNSGKTLKAMSETETYPTSAVSAAGTANFNATYNNMKGLATTMVVNFGAMNKKFGITYGRHDNVSSYMYIDSPALFGINSTVQFKVKVEQFLTTRNDKEPALFIGIREGGNKQIDLENEHDTDSDNYSVHPITYTLNMLRNGNTTPQTITQSDYQ